MTSLTRRWLAPVLAVLALGAVALTAASAHQQVVRAQDHIVVTAHPLASQVGADVLAEGGNAVDAAVAVHMALAVVYPRAGNLGGGGFLLYRHPEGSVFALDFRERAPGAATRDMYRDEEGEVVPGSSLKGPLAAGVPGSVAGMYRALAEWGSRDWSDLLRPAEELARRGFAVDEGLARDLREYREELTAFPATAAVFYPDGEAPRAGERWRQPDLARTLRRIRKEPRDFYTGGTARLIVDASRKGGGILSLEDLASYTPVLRDPVRFTYRDLEIHTMPPPSSGGLVLAQLFGVLEGFDLEAAGAGSARAVHLMVEAERQAYADRSRWMGDSDFVEVPAEALTSPAYLQAIRRSILRAEGRARSSAEVTPMVRVARPGGGASGVQESEETTHFSIVDAAGGAVSVTTTINAAYGSKALVEGAGFLLNNEMDDFSIKPGHPNLYGLVGGEFNAIEPGKRPLSSMSPTIVERKGELWAVLGTPGGSTIITSVLQVLVNLRDFGMDLPRAVAWPRIHHQWLPDRVDHEPYALSPDTRRILRRAGYSLHERSPIGDIQAVRVLEGDGGEDEGGRRLVGVSDPRGGGEPRGR